MIAPNGEALAKAFPDRIAKPAHFREGWLPTISNDFWTPKVPSSSKPARNYGRAKKRTLDLVQLAATVASLARNTAICFEGDFPVLEILVGKSGKQPQRRGSPLSQAISVRSGTVTLSEIACDGRFTSRYHAAATTSRHACMAEALKARCVLAEVRWRWTLKVL